MKNSSRISEGVVERTRGVLLMQDTYKSPQPLKLFPEKLFYKIGEVSRVVGVESYVLRYWETEFSFLSPRKSKAGQRIYAKNDVDLILQIKHLLYEEKYTIDGVRRKLGSAAEQQGTVSCPADPGVAAEAAPDAGNVLNMVKSRLKEILHHHFGA
ncbi:MAG TPA: MerR family transcriptional regulator [Dissulfurispiraceae bacterium]|nr:MerR family transcriptional regulator [Dissulfurispiraceae bacterium]